MTLQRQLENWQIFPMDSPMSKALGKLQNHWAEIYSDEGEVLQTTCNASVIHTTAPAFFGQYCPKIDSCRTLDYTRLGHNCTYTK
jgi:hypothetical protein